MVNVQSIMNLVPWNPQITAVIPRNNSVSDGLPFGRVVKSLIQVAIVPKGGVTQFTTDSQIAVTLDKRVDLHEIRVATDTFTHRPQPRSDCLRRIAWRSEQLRTAPRLACWTQEPLA